jgi:hypothetical protein
MMTAGVGGLAVVTQKTPGLGIGLSALGGVGVGGVIQPAVTMLTIISPDESIGTISAATISVRLIGATIGYAVYFNVLHNKLSRLPTNVALAAIQAGLPTNETTAFVESLLTDNKTALGQYSLAIVSIAQEAVLETYVEGFRKVYLVSISFGVCAVIASLFLKDIKKYMVDRVAVDIH